MRPFTSTLPLASLLVGVLGAPVSAHEPEKFPDTIQLPDGFRPEGIERGSHNTLFVANFEHGAVYRANARTGQGEILVPARPDRQGLGIKLDRRTDHLFVSGGTTGHAFVYDADDGKDVADITLTTAASTFINDHVITEDAVYFTDSFQPAIYRLPLGKHGRIIPGKPVETITLTGDFVFTAGGFNGNGIVVAPDGRLIIINSANGVLYSVDPATGVADAIDTGGQTFVTGDGLVLDGRTLYVIQNTNQIAVLQLSKHFRKARVDHIITDPRFDVLATGVLLGDALYVTNPRFGTDATPTTPFKVVRVDLDD
jgi:sugar lactone lactonase YvrE